MFRVLGLPLGIAGTTGLAVSDRRSVRVAALIGVVLGLLVVLYLP